MAISQGDYTLIIRFLYENLMEGVAIPPQEDQISVVDNRDLAAKSVGESCSSVPHISVIDDGSFEKRKVCFI